MVAACSWTADAPWSDEPPTARAESDTYARSLFARTAAIDKPVVERLHDVAHKRGLPSSQIALAWMLNNPAITAPIVGATKMEHLDGAVAALSVTLSKEEIGHLEELYRRPRQFHVFKMHTTSS
jgi:1-deoxyxylulose-5-phosphate synthase